MPSRPGPTPTSHRGNVWAYADRLRGEERRAVARGITTLIELAVIGRRPYPSTTSTAAAKGQGELPGGAGAQTGTRAPS